MKTFLDWLKENKADLLVDKEAEKATSEDTTRTGVSQNYPDAYVRAQYPHKYFNAGLATADLALEAKPKSTKK